jgi:hypothetical protein
MPNFRSLLLLILSFGCSVSHAQPGCEGYWGYSEIKVRLSTPEIVHSAPLDLSPRYLEADTIPPKAVELMNLGKQISERTSSLGKRLGMLGAAKRTRVLDSYVRVNLRLIGGDYEPGKAKVFRGTDGDNYYTISPSYSEAFWRYPEAVMYDRDERNRLRHQTRGVEVADADPEADETLLRKHLPMDFATHLDLLAGKAVSDETVLAAIVKASVDQSPDGQIRPVIVDYLRYNHARRLLARAAPSYESALNDEQRLRCLSEAKALLRPVRSADNLLSTAALHKLAEAEIATFRLKPGDKASMIHLEEGMRLLRICKEEGDPTAVGVIAEAIRRIREECYMVSCADLSVLPETRASLALYARIPAHSSTQRLSPGYVQEENRWIEKLESLGLHHDPSLVRLAAGLHDAGAKTSCERVLAMCPQDDGVVRLIRAHYAYARADLAGALRHLEAAENDLRTKARRHLIVLSGHFEYGLKNETEMMLGRALLEQASLLLLKGDFPGAARKLRKTGMDHFNQDYVLGCLLTIKELTQLASEESPEIDGVFYRGQDDDQGGPMARRDAANVVYKDDQDKVFYSSARVTLARRLLQEGRPRESLPYWDVDSRSDAERYTSFVDIATDKSRPDRERGLAHWRAGLILRENPNLWACSAGHELIDGKFRPRYVVANRDAMRKTDIVGEAEHARIQEAKAWTAPRNSFFRYGLAEHCLRAAELLQGEQSAYALWYGALALAYIDRQAAEPMRQKLLKEYASTKIGQQAMAAQGLPKDVVAPDMR